MQTLREVLRVRKKKHSERIKHETENEEINLIFTEGKNSKKLDEKEEKTENFLLKTFEAQKTLMHSQ